MAEEKERCWTLIWEIDQYIDGLRPGEMGVWQSRQSSDGKTAALVLLARNFAFQGKKVLFQFLEGTQEGMEDRMDQCFAGLSRAELLEGEKIERRVARYLRQGSVWMQKFPAYSTRVSELHDHAKNLRAVHNWVPDVVLVDYLDLCAPETPSLRGDLYESGREIYSRFLEWLQTDGVPGWTALQSNRQAMKEQTAGQAHTGGSLAKVQLAHLVLSINRSPDEKRLGEATVMVVKNRDGRANMSFTIRSDFERMAFAVPEQNVVPPMGAAA
jgi:replicative DNA helicase